MHDKWIELVKAFEADPCVDLQCPECGEGRLQMTDVPYRGHPPRGERLICCSRCRAGAALRRPGAEGNMAWE